MSELHNRNASLYLSTHHIQLGDGGTFNTVLVNYDCSKGTIANLGQTLTWKRIDFRAVLGDLFDKYMMFNIRLSGLHYVTNAQAQQGNDLIQICWISFSGANMPQQTYNHLTGGVTAESPLAVIPLSNGTGNNNSLHTPHVNLVSFARPQSGFADITLDMRHLRTVSGKTLVNNPIGHVAFLFDIFPIFESKIEQAR